MRRQLDRIFNKYGTAAVIASKERQQAVKVFFRSDNSTSWQNMERMFCPLGEVPRGQYICLFPMEARVAVEDTVIVDGRSYLVRKLEEIRSTKQALCRWSLCVEKGSEDTWGLNG